MSLSEFLHPPLALPLPPGKLLPLEEGLGHLRANDYRAAIASLLTALKREPGRFAAVRGLVTAYLLDGHPTHAQAVMSKFVADHPMSADGWQLAAQLAWKLGEFASAIDLLRAGLERLPHSPKLRRQLCIFRAARGEFDANGSTGITQETTLDPDWLDQIAADPVLLNAVLTFLQFDNDALAIESRSMLQKIERKLSTLLAAQPNHADRQLLLATLQARLDDLPAALQSVDRALACNPKLAAAHRLRATVLARTGETEVALSILRNLVQRGFSWPDLHYQIADLEQQSGRATEARAHLYSAICLNPKFSEARQFLERIAA
jgi:tetratricopeptide (TPR) repeat protein